MKKIFLILMMAVTGSVLYAQKTINDANVEKRDVGSFTAIRVSSAFDVYISQGDAEVVAVSASKPEYRNHIVTKVENGVLIIRLDAEKNFWKGANNVKLRAYISVKKLEMMNISGACDVNIENGLSSNELKVTLSGASSLKGKVDVKNLVVDLSGASDVTLSGNADKVSVETSGASDFKSFDLATNYCDVNASGASTVNITVNKELSAKASGASDIRYKGEGLIRDIRTSGASNITRKS
jgi:hypothetical protein